MGGSTPFVREFEQGSGLQSNRPPVRGGVFGSVSLGINAEITDSVIIADIPDSIANQIKV